ncbi:hypothetical protein MUN78_14110 [Leucobacter allii]|uniref:Lipoprotein n=1 Tax=Leucobacter allii TaxID=2932247 RepID=A0ABY4FJN7_9MICO|nr:hypothetical protein [Leucobacter allii]UOQ56788.1 hypothetical protein MUN78_14110 [Leucobacter allii]
MAARRSRYARSAAAAGAAIAATSLLSGCGLIPSFISGTPSAESPAEPSAPDATTDARAQQQFFDNTMLMIPMVASVDPSSSWASIEPVPWDQADPALRETIVGMGEDACVRADAAAGTSELEDPAMTWLAARFLCPEHRELADEFLSNGASVSPTHSMADLFELALLQDDDASTDEVLTANDSCMGALAIAWEVADGATFEMTCWLIRVQSVEATGGGSEYRSLFTDAGELGNAESDARFSELAEASGAAPNQLSELLDGAE